MDVTDWNVIRNGSNTSTDPTRTEELLIEDIVGTWVVIILPPVIFVFGVVGNILSMLVFSRGNWSHGTMPIYLVTLAVTDTSVLVVGLVRLWLISVFEWDLRRISSIACKTLTFAAYVFIYFSSWIIVAITAERVIVITFPHGWKCTRKKAKLLLIFLGVVTCGLGGHILYGFSLDDSGDCKPVHTVEYYIFFTTVWSWIDLLLSSIAPSCVLVVANAAIIWQIRRSNSALSEFAIRARRNNRGGASSSAEPTRTLIVLSVVYMMTTLPICVVIQIIASWPEHVDNVTRAKLTLAFNMTYVLMYCNNAANFYLYCLSGSTFRRQLLRLIPCHGLHRDTSKPTLSSTGNELSVIQQNDVVCFRYHRRLD